MPALAGAAQRRGYEATCNRNRGMLGVPDPELLERVASDGFVLVTNNQADFVLLCTASDLHAGLVVLPQGRRDTQLQEIEDALAHIKGPGCVRGRAAGRLDAEPRARPTPIQLTVIVKACLA